MTGLKGARKVCGHVGNARVLHARGLMDLMGCMRCINGSIDGRRGRELSVAPPHADMFEALEGEDNGHVREVDVFAGPGFLDEIPSEKVAVTAVEEQVAIDLPVEQDIEFRADVLLASRCTSRSSRWRRGGCRR